MKSASGRESNALLDRLSRSDAGLFAPYLTRVPLASAEVLHDRRGALRYVYFPVSGVIGIHTRNIGRISLSLVGREGWVGSDPGGSAAPLSLVVVHGKGSALRMDARRFRAAAVNSATIQRHLHWHTNRLLQRATQNVLCNSYHVVLARLARSILEGSDQAGSDEITMTQQALAYVIGVRRAAINAAANELRRRNLIRYARGRVTLVDRRGLSRLACPCYQALLQGLPGR